MPVAKWNRQPTKWVGKVEIQYYCLIIFEIIISNIKKIDKGKFYFKYHFKPVLVQKGLQMAKKGSQVVTLISDIFKNIQNFK